MIRTVPLAAAVLLLVSLAGCATAGPDSPAVTAAPSEASPAVPAPDVTTPAVASGRSGCDIVTAQMIVDNLLIEAGNATTKPSLTAGGDTCDYEFASLTVQLSNQPDLYFPADTYDGHDLPGSLPVTTADRGYAINGSFVVVKGSLGVFFTGYVPDSTPEQWQALANAVGASL